jgi:phosphoglycerate dehydrogenase-like enzyme
MQIKADVIKATIAKPGSKLRLVARAGVGVDNVDLAAATAAGIMVRTIHLTLLLSSEAFSLSNVPAHTTSHILLYEKR